MPEDDKTLIQTALDRFQLAAEAESSWRAESLEDLQFSTGDQWPKTIRDAREKKNKPCLVMDQIQQGIRITCNEYRQQRPSITVSPVGSGADVDTAEIIQGAIRHIEVLSDAEIAYDGAHEALVRTGIGHWRILLDYADDESDAMDIWLKPIRNQFSVYWQPGVPHHEAEWCFVVSDPPMDTYKAEYADSEVATTSLQGIGNAPAEWITKEYVRVAEYFTLEKVKGAGKREKREVRWRKINAFEVLEGGKEGQLLPGSSIPILTAYGDDLDVNGKRYLAGLVRNAKGPQRMYNYFCSAATQTMALAPVAPIQAVAGQLSGFERSWEAANSGDVTVLYWKQTDAEGKEAPPPQRITVEPPIQAMEQLVARAGMDLRAATGLYDPSLGQRKGDESGKAIERLQQQGDIATLNYSDNMAREMRRCGRLLIEWIRALYDEPKIQRIIKPDGSVDQVVIHNGPEQAEKAQQLLSEQQQLKSKISKIYDIGVGKYDVVVDVGPSYKTKRQEAVATQLDFLKMLPPEIGHLFIDLVTANMDWPQAQEFAKRARIMLPPQLQEQNGDPEARANALQAQLAQLTQQHQQMTEVLARQNQIINEKHIEQQTKLQVEKMKTDTDQLIAKAKIDAQIAVAEINTKAQALSERIEWIETVYKELHGSAHDLGMQVREHAHQKELADQAAANAQQTQAADQAHQQQMAEQQQEQPVGAE